MAHPPDGELRALLDGELSAARGEEVQHHTASCAACAASFSTIEELAATTGRLLKLLDPPPLTLELATVVRRARRAAIRRSGLMAAAVTLFIVAVAGATVGRPYVRALAARVWAVVHAAGRTRAPTTPSRPAQAGVALVPGALVEVAFDAAQDSGLLRVWVVDTGDVTVLARTPVTYRVYQGGVVVHNRGSVGSYDVVVPQDAPHVRIVIAGRVLLEKIGPRVIVSVPADSAGRYVIPMAGRSP